MRDHRKLEAFTLADALTMCVYRVTSHFPMHKRYGLTSQLRRAAVSVGANIVEGSARATAADYAHFLNVAYSSACELEYEISIAIRLGYVPQSAESELLSLASRTCRALHGLARAFR